MSKCNLPAPIKCRLLVPPDTSSQSDDEDGSFQLLFWEDRKGSTIEMGDTVLDGEFDGNGHIFQDPRAELEEVELAQVIERIIFDVERGRDLSDFSEIIAELSELERMQIKLIVEAVRRRIAHRSFQQQSA